MANSPEMLEELVRHARYPPEGQRGFFGSSRAVRYGLFGSITEEQRRINRELCLMAQIETREAVERAETLCQVPGIDAIFVGLGDLSLSMGAMKPTDTSAVQRAIDRTIALAQRYGKLVAVPGQATEYAQWARKGVDLLFCGSDVSCLRMGVQTILRQARGEAP